MFYRHALIDALTGHHICLKNTQYLLHHNYTETKILWYIMWDFSYLLVQFHPEIWKLKKWLNNYFLINSGWMYICTYSSAFPFITDQPDALQVFWWEVDLGSEQYLCSSWCICSALQGSAWGKEPSLYFLCTVSAKFSHEVQECKLFKGHPLLSPQILLALVAEGLLTLGFMFVLLYRNAGFYQLSVIELSW